MVPFAVNLTQPVLSGEKNLNWGITEIRLPCDYLWKLSPLSIAVEDSANCEWHHSLSKALSCMKNLAEQARGQHWYVPSAVPASWLQIISGQFYDKLSWVPGLNSPQWGKVTWNWNSNKLFILLVAFYQVICHNNRNRPRTLSLRIKVQNIAYINIPNQYKIYIMMQKSRPSIKLWKLVKGRWETVNMLLRDLSGNLQLELPCIPNKPHVYVRLSQCSPSSTKSSGYHLPQILCV